MSDQIIRFEDLKPYEIALARAVGRGELFDFNAWWDDAAKAAWQAENPDARPEAKPEFTGALVRALFLGLVRDDKDAVIASPAGVRIEGAVIRGKLDLNYASGVNSETMPALVLRDCDVHDVISLEGARLDSLILRYSRISGVEGRGMYIASQLDISYIRPVGLSWLGPDAPRTGEDEEPALKELKSRLGDLQDGEAFDYPCFVNIRGGQVMGNVYGLGAILCSDAPRGSDEAVPAHREPQYCYALRLTECQIGGSIYLTQGVRAYGGVVIRNSTVAGNVQAQRAVLEASDGHGFSVQNSQIGGAVQLNDIVCRGSVCVQEARIEGSLRLDGANIAWLFAPPCRAASKAKDRVPGWADALNGDRARIGGDVLFGESNDVANDETPASERNQPRPTVIEGGVSFVRATVGGDLRWSGLTIAPRRSSEVAFILEQTDGSPLVSEKTADTNFRAIIDLERAAIGGSLWADKLTALGPDGAPASMKTMRERKKRSKRDEIDLHPLIKLNAASAGLLRDDQAKSATTADRDSLAGWGDETLVLEIDGFVYELPSEPNPLKRRREWLKRQFPLRGNQRQVDDDHYRSQPFAEAADCLARIGLEGDSRAIQLMSRGYLRKAGSAAAWLPRAFYGGVLGYLITPWRPVIALLVVFVLGWIGAAQADRSGMLEIEVLVYQAVDQGPLNSEQAEAFIRSAAPCGAEVDPGIYALDVFVPLIDLRFENRCDVPDEPLHDGPYTLTGVPFIDKALPLEHVTFWRWGKALYELLGWVFLSVVIVTVSRALGRSK